MPTDARIADEDLAQTTDPDYATDEYDEEYFRWIVRNKHYRSFKLRMRWIDELVKPAAGDKIVDLGCGAGMVAEHCGRAGAIVHGVDLSPVAVRVAQEVNKDLPNVTFEVGDASDVPSQQPSSFDKAISADVTEHCGYDVMMGIFREAHRLLKPGGTYFIYTPNPLHWIEVGKEHGPQIGPFKQHPAHTGLRTAPVLKEALEQAGFEVLANPKTPSMIPGLNLLEKLWSNQPIFPQLGVYRVVLLARKPA
jgi:2-polyprenyl-3-methyl-5-hydroxy-6-metoxy-1,4-benzoquinol methylase